MSAVGTAAPRLIGAGWGKAPVDVAKAVAAADVVIVGAGVTGSSLAVSLARRGVRSVLIEARGEQATRFTQLNLAPSSLDVLDRIGARHTLATLDPIAAFHQTDAVTGAVKSQNYSGAFELRPEHADRGVRALVESIDGTDPRTWGRAPIGGVENGLRADARDARLIQPIFDMKLRSVGSTEPGRVSFTLAGSDGLEQALEGKLLINATGSRPVEGLRHEWHMSPHEAHFIGGRFNASAADGAEHTAYHLHGDTVEIALHGDEHTIVWREVPKLARDFDRAEAASLVNATARNLHIGGRLEPDDVIPLTVTAGRNMEPVQGGVVSVGDASRIPNFRTSSGANTGITADVPAVTDAVEAIVRRGADPATELGRLRGRLHETNHLMFDVNERQLVADIGPAAAAVAD